MLRLWILCLLVVPLARSIAQDSTPSSLVESDVAARTRAAIEELTTLQATARADREAFRQNEADLERAIGEYRKPLPVPPNYQSFLEYRPEAIQAETAKADAYRQAWEAQQTRYRRAAETLERLDRLAGTLRATHERLLDRIADLRPLLIETQRKVDRRELKEEDVRLGDGAATVAEWITASGELLSRRDELLGEVDALIQRLASARASFEGLPPGDPEAARRARRIKSSLSTFAEATAVSDEQFARLAQTPPEAVPSELAKAIDEWKAREDTLAAAVATVEESHERLRAILQEQAALEVPRRQDVPAGEGFREVRDARQAAGLAARMVGYYEKSLELVKTANARREELLATIAAATALHADYTRQGARVMVWIEHAGKLAQEGALAGWTRPPELSEQIVWDSWLRRQAEQLDRLELAEQVRPSIVGADAIASATARIQDERETEKRAAAQLETELSYAEFVSRMEDLTDEQLLELLVPGGEIAQKLGALESDRSTIDAIIAASTEKCLKIVRAIQTNENPYSQSAFKESAGLIPQIREALEKLEPGTPYPEDADNLKVVARPAPLSIRDVVESEKRQTAAELAENESRYLASEQQFARFFLNYFVNLQSSLESLRQAVAERRDLERQLESRFEEIIREEKRRYAAALQLRRHHRGGRLDASKLPEDLDKWLGRAPIVQATQDLRTARRAGASFHARTTYEIERLEQLTAGIEWMRIRTEKADERVRLSGRPVAHLTAALTPITEIGDVERQNLQYRARVTETVEESALEALLERFTSAEERRRFEDPLSTYYLEFANTERVKSDLDSADNAYELMADSCLSEKEKLEPLRSSFDKTVALRLADYQAACYAAAAVAHPSARARLEEAYRVKYGRDLPYRLDLPDGDLDRAADLVFSAQIRLRAGRSIARDADLLLSKVGLEQEIGWYRSQVARIGTLLKAETLRQDDLRGRITDLRATYRELLEINATRGLSITLFIPLVAFLVVRFLKRLSRRFEHRMMQKQDEEFSDRQRRLQTVSKTSTAAISVLVWTIAIVYVFARLGLDITPIVASASVVGLAVAFGAQTLIKDFFSGFFILLENQFTIGDVVTLGTITGTVENISLRITVLRDLRGVVHYIPNGSIGQVSNLTQGWSRVVMEISVSYKEDPDHVTRILGDVLLEMARDETWRRDIIEEPVVAGVEMLTERSVDIRVMIKTRPGQQWAVAREARKRIKRRFDELGIEIPFPHRVVHHVYEGAERPAPAGERGDLG